VKVIQENVITFNENKDYIVRAFSLDVTVYVLKFKKYKSYSDDFCN
jgi:hypothetical protein